MVVSMVGRTITLAGIITALSCNSANAGCNPSTGSDSANNTCIGSDTLTSNTIGSKNTAIGHATLYANTSGQNNTAIGSDALAFSNTGSYNTASGTQALWSNTTGAYNTASGSFALGLNTTGANNVAVGYGAARAQTTGISNTALGYQAGIKWTTGANNIAVGAGSAMNQTAGSNNITIGSPGAARDNGTIRIGLKGSQTATFIAGIQGVNVTGGQAVLVSANGQLGVASSSLRYKQNIQTMGTASDALMQLRPVTFRYKQAEADGSRPMQYGLIAEEVAEVMPELAVYNEDGTPESVAYQVLPSLLLNEYQKQAKELAAEKRSRLAAEARLEAIEAEMASMKLMLSKLAAAQSGKVQFAAAP